MDEYSCEILIIGAGPAGLAAGIYCGRSGRNSIILEGKEPPAILLAKEIYNYPGFERIEGPKLQENFRKPFKNYKTVKFLPGDVISLMVGMGKNLISTRTANITADVVIIATGRGLRKEKIKGEDRFIGYGVSYCALCDGPIYKGKTVYLYGSDEELFEDGLILTEMGCDVKIIVPKPLNALPENLTIKVEEVKKRNIEITENTDVVEIIGDHKGIVQKIICKPVGSSNLTENKTFNLSCLFIFSHVPSNAIFKKAGVELDDKGNIKIDKDQHTNLKSIFAAGDVTGGLYQVVFATAEGAKAGIMACKYLRHLKNEPA